jgi:hypothetical protein
LRNVYNGLLLDLEFLSVEVGSLIDVLVYGIFTSDLSDHNIAVALRLGPNLTL